MTGDFMAAVAAPTPTPGGGSATAHAGALAAALAHMVAGLTAGRAQYQRVDAQMREIARKADELGATLSELVIRDVEAYGAVSAAYNLPREGHEAARARDEAIARALLHASEIPLETARACALVTELAASVATLGNSNAVADAAVAALLAEAACKGAAYNVRVNVAALRDRSPGAPLLEEAHQLVYVASKASATAAAAVERSIERR
jgi:glutamate formiminotransferase/formiminotetrahydrofolate cyclodeaminase